MARLGSIFLIAALGVFLAFFSNVAMSAAGSGSFLTDVTEMLVLLGAAILFVVGVLARETHEKTSKGEIQND